MKKIISLMLILSLISLTVSCTQYHAQGAGAGGVVGGIAGAILNHKNPWKGGVIGAALGGILGATLSDVSMRATQEAASTGRPVEYRTEDGRSIYQAEVVGYNAQTRCHKVHEIVTENDRVVKDQIREICDSDKIEPRY